MNHQIVLVVAMCICSVTCALESNAADQPELLKGTSAQVENRLRLENDYFVKKNGYTSKRSRMIQFDTSVLLGDAAEIDISFFDDVRVIVRRIDLDVDENGLNFHWTGVRADAPFTLQKFKSSNPRLADDVAERIYDQQFGISIRGSKFVFVDDPAESSAVTGYKINMQNGRLERNDQLLAEELRTGTVVYDVRLDLRYFDFSNSSPRSAQPRTMDFKVRSLPADRRYSVVYELDPNKRVPISEVGIPLTPEMQAKRDQYDEFLRSLGPDPSREPANGGTSE